MCQTPITIANRSRRFTDGVSPRHFHVACGHCYECRKRQQDDWFVRSFFEYQRVRKDGSCWFFTLTYDDIHLPYWRDTTFIDPLDESKTFVRPCFNPLDLKRFRDSLRVYLSRSGFPITDIRFFIACELGGKFGRPHYHPLLFLPFHIPFKVLFGLIKKAWPKGRVGFSPRYGMLVTSEKAVSYCCKYVSKESYWWKRFRLDEYLVHLVHDVHDMVEGSEERLKSFRRFYRLHFQSMKYGVDGVQSISNSMLVNDRINLLDFGLNPDESLKNSEFAIPSYYKSKLLKDIDDYNTQRDNSLAVAVKEERFSNLVSIIEDGLKVYFDYRSFCQHFAPLKLSEVTLHDIFTSLHDLLSECKVVPSPRVMAIYSLVYQDLNFSTDNFDCWPIPFLGVTHVHLRCGMTPSDCISLLVKKASYFYSHRSKFERDEPDAEGHSRFDLDRKFFSAKIPDFGTLPCFFGFDNFLNDVSHYEYQLGKVLSDSKDAIDDERYNTALITGVLDNKYCFVFNPVFEL